MKKQRRALNRYKMLKDGKKRKKVSIKNHDTLTLTVKKNPKKKEREKQQQQQQNGVNGIRTHIH